MHSEDAAKTISECDYGLHCLVIYSVLSMLRKFYSQYIPKQINDKEEIIQIMPFYETDESVRQVLYKGYNEMNTAKIKEGEEERKKSHCQL
jgi:hypothetical protein